MWSFVERTIGPGATLITCLGLLCGPTLVRLDALA
jgi:hypothetical protein